MKQSADKHLILWISSLTGNTESIACVLIRTLLEEGLQPLLAGPDRKMLAGLCGKYGLKEADSVDPEADLPVILCFWCRRGTMDDRSASFLASLKRRRLLVFGTMGSYPASPYGRMVYENVKNLADRENLLRGLFLCRGRIDPARTERRRRLSKDHLHYLDDEAYARHLSSRSHPDENDKRNAAAFLLAHLSDLL